MIYAFITKGENIICNQFNGMSREIVEAMLASQGLTYEIIEQKEFEGRLETMKQDETSKRTAEEMIRSAFLLTAKNKSKAVSERLDALASYVGVDLDK